MKILAALLFLLTPILAFAGQSCALDEVKLTSNSPLAERLFYVGTCHYRTQEYTSSVALWKELSLLKNIDPEHVELQISSLNNLGYMFFFGYGVVENKSAALAYWKQAIGLGHTEAEYHLCHAYADPKVSTYNPVKALPHCEKAKLIYQGMEKKESDEKTMLKQINNYIQHLKK
jgi:hypothetical protein